MSTLLEKKIRINRTLTVSLDHAKSIEDEMRMEILQLLYKKQLNAEQIAIRLKKLGYKKALTTIRHHIEILKDSDLIEIVKIIESRGANSEGFKTIVHPAASAGITLSATWLIGQFQGVIRAQTPFGS